MKRKHFRHRLLTKIPATIGPQNERNHLSISTLQGIICDQEFHHTSFCNHAGTSKNLSKHRPSAELHCRHRRSEATFDIRTFDTSQLRPQESMHHANPELCSTRNQCQYGRHTRHPEYRKRGPDPFRRQQPRYHL